MSYAGQLLQEHRLARLELSDGNLIIEARPDEMYQITVRVVDKRLKAKKKKSLVLDVDITVPYRDLAWNLNSILQQLKKLTKEDSTNES